MRSATDRPPQSGARRPAAELGVLSLAGLFLGLIGPYGTDEAPILARLAYWQVNIVGGGSIGLLIDALLAAKIGSRWLRLFIVSAVMTPPVTLLVIANASVLLGHGGSVRLYFELLWQVFAIALPVMTLHMLVWRPPERLIETRTLIEPPLPEAEEAFRRRLSARRRSAPLIAVEAHDHYLRVHTGAGTELITMRFADALDELANAYGFQVHRSWWVSAEAIETVRWRRGSGEARLTGGLVAPVSRSRAPLLRAAGWH